MASERIQRQIERLLDDAEEAVARRDWQAVLDTAQHVLTIDPDNADGQAFVTIAERGLKATPALAAQNPSAAALSPTVEQPTTFANGRYQVSEFLGEGGRKRVYQAHDTSLDRDVALAVIKTEGQDPDLPRPHHPGGAQVAVRESHRRREALDTFTHASL